MPAFGGNFLFQPYGSPNMQKWTSYTPTGSWNTNVTYTGFYTIINDTAMGIAKIACSGAPNNTALLLNLPVTIDTSKLTTTDAGFQPILGDVVAMDAAISDYFGFAVFSSTTQLQCYVGNAASTYLKADNFSTTVPFTFGSGDAVIIRWVVPV